MITLSSARRARLLSTAVVLAAGSLAGCGDRSTHASDGDTGAAAPATKIDLTRTPRPGDSTPAVAKPAGGADAASGDTAGTRAKDSARARSAGKPTRP
ncbi:MAG TPA: hypothetical protein VGG84_09645 [Gemmatimonadaceae bacterium]|jgi:hypothetical protein